MPKYSMFEFKAARNELRIGSRIYRLPQRASARIMIGGGLVAGGVLGFLPVLGFWMIPLGLLVLSQDLPAVRRWRRSLVVRIERRKAERIARRARSRNETPKEQD